MKEEVEHFRKRCRAESKQFDFGRGVVLWGDQFFQEVGKFNGKMENCIITL